MLWKVSAMGWKGRIMPLLEAPPFSARTLAPGPACWDTASNQLAQRTCNSAEHRCTDSDLWRLNTRNTTGHDWGEQTRLPSRPDNTRPALLPSVLHAQLTLQHTWAPSSMSPRSAEPLASSSARPLVGACPLPLRGGGAPGRLPLVVSAWPVPVLAAPRLGDAPFVGGLAKPEPVRVSSRSRSASSGTAAGALPTAATDAVHML